MELTELRQLCKEQRVRIVLSARGRNGVVFTLVAQNRMVGQRTHLYRPQADQTHENAKTAALKASLVLSWLRGQGYTDEAVTAAVGALFHPVFTPAQGDANARRE